MQAYPSSTAVVDLLLQKNSFKKKAKLKILGDFEISTDHLISALFLIVIILVITVVILLTTVIVLWLRIRLLQRSATVNSTTVESLATNHSQYESFIASSFPYQDLPQVNGVAVENI